MQHIAAWFADTLTGSLKAFEFFQFENSDDSGITDVVGEVKLHSKLMSMQMDAALIIWENPECTFVPDEFFIEEIAETYLEIIAGEAAGTSILKEHFKGYIILSRYSSSYADAVKKHLASGPFSHKFSFLIEKYTRQAGENADIIRVVFYPEKLIIIVVKNGILQIVQSISYSTAEDVLYNIVHICNEYGIDLATTSVVLSGLINTGSALFDTLYKYIENVEIEKSAPNTFAAEGFAEHPAQYFLPFIQ